MALIKCPGCGELISDRSAKCVKCGYILQEEVQEEKKACPECGAELEKGAEICSNCGCPVEIEQPTETDASTGTESSSQQVEVVGIKTNPKNKKKLIIIIIVAVVAVIALLAGGSAVKKQNAVKASAAYEENLQLATYSMLTGASEAETCGNLIKQVWYNAIYEEKDSETDEYTRPDGYFVSDFNDALQNLFSDSDFTGQIADIEDNQDTVAKLMKELQNPPEEWEAAYDDLQELYDAYLDLTNLVTSPSGSLQTYSSNFNDADSETANAYEKMSLYFE